MYFCHTFIHMSRFKIYNFHLFCHLFVFFLDTMLRWGYFYHVALFVVAWFYFMLEFSYSCEFTKDDRVFIVRVFCLPSLCYKSSVFDIAGNVGYFKTCLRYLISRPRLLGRHEK